MNDQSRLQRDLNALGIVRKEQRYCTLGMKVKITSNQLSDCFHIFYLFFLYEPLCMSLHDVVADYLWSCGVKKAIRPQNLFPFGN